MKVGVSVNDNNYLKVKILMIVFIVVVFIASLLIVIHGVEKTAQNQTVNLNIGNTEDKNNKINLNSCSYEALITFPTIDKVKAEKIIENRPYVDIYQIMKIDGIGKETLEAIKNRAVTE